MEIFNWKWNSFHWPHWSPYGVEVDGLVRKLTYCNPFTPQTRPRRSGRVILARGIGRLTYTNIRQMALPIEILQSSLYEKYPCRELQTKQVLCLLSVCTLPNALMNFHHSWILTAMDTRPCSNCYSRSRSYRENIRHYRRPQSPGYLPCNYTMRRMHHWQTPPRTHTRSLLGSSHRKHRSRDRPKSILTMRELERTGCQSSTLAGGKR